MRVIPYDEEQEALALLREALLRATTSAQKTAIELDIERLYRLRDQSIEAARKSMIAFGVRCVPKWRPEAFHLDLGGRLQSLILRIHQQPTVSREIAIAPPQHGKSLLSCIIAPVWAMGKRPGLNVGVITYAGKFSTKHSRAARALADSPAVREVFGDPKTANKTDIDQADEWSAWGGTYIARGIDGAITGVPLDLLIADDLLKNAAEARSPTLREKAHEAYHSAAGTRFSAGGAVMLQGTTWHGDDPLQREMATGRYHVTFYPAIAENDEPFRKTGEALCPKLKPLDFLLDQRNGLPAEVWACLYQGKPGRAGSEYIPSGWLVTYQGRPEDQAAAADVVWITMDTGKATHAKADPTVCHVWAWWKAKKDTPARMALLDRLSWVGASIENGKDMLRLLKWRWGKWLTGVLIEDTVNGAAILQQGVSTATIDNGLTASNVPAECAQIAAWIRVHDFKNEPIGIASGMLHSFSPVSVPGRDKSKLARAEHLRAVAQRGRVSVPTVQELPTVHDAIDCWATLPTAAHDEDADCASSLVIHLEQNTTSKAAGLRYLMAMTG